MPTNRYDEIKKVMIAKTIVDNGSIQKAAKILKVTPSAVSQSLTALEKKLGAPLFVRTKGKITPTAHCLALLEKTQPVFSAIDSLFSDEEQSLEIATLDLGTYESLAHSFLPKFIDKIRSAHPKVKLNIIVKRTAEVIKRLRSGELCTAIVVESDNLQGINCIEIAQEELGIYVAKKYAEKISESNFIKNLGFGILSLSTDGMPSYMGKFLKQLGHKPKVILTSDSFEVLSLAAKEGILCAVLPKRVAQRNREELVEVKEIEGKPLNYSGRHKIFLISLDKCDQEEARYLADLAKQCL